MTPEVAQGLAASEGRDPTAGSPRTTSVPTYVTRQDPDNVRSRLLPRLRQRANELLETQGYRKISHLTPHTLRRTFSSLLAEVDVRPRRAMYLIGHTDPTLTMRVYQQVMDMGGGGPGGARAGARLPARRGVRDLV